MSVQTNYDKLTAGDFPVVTETVTIASGNSITKGTIIGKNAGGKCVPADGSAVTAYGVAIEDCDASAADRKCAVALTGEFLAEGLTAAEGTEVSDLKDSLRALSIFVK